MDQKPSIGRVVHFVVCFADGSVPSGTKESIYPGIITAVADYIDGTERCNLVTFGDGSMHFHHAVPEEKAGMVSPYWRWPPRV